MTNASTSLIHVHVLCFSLETIPLWPTYMYANIRGIRVSITWMFRNTQGIQPSLLQATTMPFRLSRECRPHKWVRGEEVSLSTNRAWCIQCTSMLLYSLIVAYNHAEFPRRQECNTTKKEDTLHALQHHTKRAWSVSFFSVVFQSCTMYNVHVVSIKNMYMCVCQRLTLSSVPCFPGVRVLVRHEHWRGYPFWHAGLAFGHEIVILTTRKCCILTCTYSVHTGTVLNTN